MIYGEEVYPHTLPWMARLTLDTGDCDSLCGGVLISRNLVLTAAHCEQDKYTFAALGDHDCDYPDNGQTWIGIEKYINHPDYYIDEKRLCGNDTNRVACYAINDISIAVLMKKVHYSDTILPICLPSIIYHNMAHQPVFAAGWGNQNTGDTGDYEDYEDYAEYSRLLQRTIVEIQPDDVCQIPEKDYNYIGGYNASSMWCIGDPEYIKGNQKRHKGVSHGDSGGML